MTTSSQQPFVEQLDPALDVVTAVRALAHWPRLLLLDSALQRQPVGRYSFLTADPVAHWQLDAPRYGLDPFADVSAAWERWQGAAVPGLPPFQGGIAGLLGYELGQCWERIPSAVHNEFQLPVMAVGLYDWVLAWDHFAGTLWLISQGWPETDEDRRSRRAADRLHQVKTELSKAVPASDSSSPTPRMDLSFAAQFPLGETANVTSTFTRDEYLRNVARVIEYIYAGDVFQANLSQRLLAPAPCPSLELFARLRTVNPAPFAALMQWDDWSIVSASPERFLCVTDGEVETRPIKGTRQRKRGPEADLFTRDELRESDKDQAENVMIVDLLRNDLSRVCQPNSIRVPQLCTVESYETVQHLVSEVRGQLRQEATIWDLFRATFPGGSITGAPKVRAMEIIAELEPTVRGPYCGSLFYVGPDGRIDSNLLIRTFVQRHGWLQCNVGGGIVAQSNPAAEYEETLTKAAGMLKAL
ncbi:aminodeoxychorismate synthase component I [Schlesneria paludicola]|uniref:aminodeoxychorismate synthase component I n=1 Tax=Schlesneria paludicola TaxID=360056 RepID=UPI00029B2116|nr:aminodeoxychorismate synthase component I [Schlesneria paludicola]